MDSEGMWAKFHDVMTTVIDKFVPKASRKKFVYPKWMNRESSKARNNKVNVATGSNQGCRLLHNWSWTIHCEPWPV